MVYLSFTLSQCVFLQLSDWNIIYFMAGASLSGLHYEYRRYNEQQDAPRTIFKIRNGAPPWHIGSDDRNIFLKSKKPPIQLDLM
jgi:hypothetical protein